MTWDFEGQDDVGSQQDEESQGKVGKFLDASGIIGLNFPRGKASEVYQESLVGVEQKLFGLYCQGKKDGFKPYLENLLTVIKPSWESPRFTYL